MLKRCCYWVILLFIAISTWSCGGDDNPSTMSPMPPVICTAELRPALVVTVLDPSGQIAAGEIIEVTPLSLVTFSTPAKYVVCGDPQGGIAGIPTTTVDSCQFIAIGDQAGSYQLRLLATDADPFETVVGTDECGVVTQDVELVQGSFNPDLACNSGSFTTFCPAGSDAIQITDPVSPPGCNPELPTSPLTPVGDTFCELMPSPSCDECNL